MRQEEERMEGKVFVFSFNFELRVKSETKWVP